MFAHWSDLEKILCKTDVGFNVVELLSCKLN